MPKETKIICKYCLTSFDTTDFLQTHINLNHRTNSINKKFRCFFCDEKFTRNYNLKVHIRSKHSQKRNVYFCSFCQNRAFDTHEKLQAHIFSEHVLQDDQSVGGFKKIASALKNAMETYSINLIENEILTINQIQSQEHITESLLRLISNKTLKYESFKFSLVSISRFIKTSEKSEITSLITTVQRSKQYDVDPFKLPYIQEILMAAFRDLNNRVIEFEEKGSGYRYFKLTIKSNKFCFLPSFTHWSVLTTISL